MSASPLTQIPDGFRCPSWCEGGPAGHQQALDEGCPPEAALVHSTADLAGMTQEWNRNRYSTWGLQVRSHQQPDLNHWATPMVFLETSTTTRGQRQAHELVLTSGQARTLAAQLVRLADKIDLD